MMLVLDTRCRAAWPRCELEMYNVKCAVSYVVTGDSGGGILLETACRCNLGSNPVQKKG